MKFEGKDPTYHMHTGKGIVEFDSVDKLITYAVRAQQDRRQRSAS